MAVFSYRGLVVASGKQSAGVRDADNLRTLRMLLKREGILLTCAHEETVKHRRAFAWRTLFERIGVADLSLLTRQLATLVRAGIPLVECVSALTEQVEQQELKRILGQVRDRLNEGLSLAKALEAHPTVFPTLYVNMVAAGEASGTLEQVLERLAHFLEEQNKLRGKVGATLAYPALMALIGVVLISIMMTVVVPKVTSIFASLNRALPWYTSLMITLSKAFSSTQTLGFLFGTLMATGVRAAVVAYRRSPVGVSPLLLLAAGGSTLLFVWGAWVVESLGAYAAGAGVGLLCGLAFAQLLLYLQTYEGKLYKDTLLLRLPIFGNLLRLLAVSRFARTLSTLLQSGVPVLKAMDIVKQVIENTKLARVIGEAASSIREGESIAGPLKRSGDFPPLVIHMIAVGEKSGELEQMLENIASAYDVQINNRIQALTSLLEPLMIVLMGGAVGFIAFSILMPLVQMSDF